MVHTEVFQRFMGYCCRSMCKCNIIIKIQGTLACLHTGAGCIIVSNMTFTASHLSPWLIYVF